MAAPTKKPIFEDLVDMTAMVDIVFFLLIFFMVTSMAGSFSSIGMPTPDPQKTAARGQRSAADFDQDKEYIVVRVDPGRVTKGQPWTRFKQMRDGSLVGTDSPDPPDLPAHAQIREHAVDFPDEAIRALHGNRALTKIIAFLPGARGAALDHVTLGFRPMPMDGLPVVGRVPGAPGFYTVVTHSGVTLAPILGQYVRAELLRGEDEPMLAPYRPGRFAPAARRAASCV